MIVYKNISNICSFRKIQEIEKLKKNTEDMNLFILKNGFYDA